MVQIADASSRRLCHELFLGSRFATCEKMKSNTANHWWDFEDNTRKMYQRSWEWISAPKSFGGMGFRFVLFNQAMLGKQCCWLITNPSSLCARVLRGRYYPNSDFLTVVKPLSASFTWRSCCWKASSGELAIVRGLILLNIIWSQFFQMGLSLPLAWDKETIRVFFRRGSSSSNPSNSYK